MAYDEGLAERVRERLRGHRGVTEKCVSSELVFLHNGNLAVGVHGDELLVRVGPKASDAALSRPGVRQFEDQGRRMNGWVLVAVSVLVDDVALYDWIDQAHAFAASLPPR